MSSKEETGERVAITDHTATQILLMPDSKRIDWVKFLLKHCKYDHEKYVLIMSYHYGLRPKELMSMGKDNFKLLQEPDGLTLRVFLPTVKKGKDRTIDYSTVDVPFISWLAEYVTKATTLLPKSWEHTSNINQAMAGMCRRANHKRLPPYAFRKFRLSNIVRDQDARLNDVVTFKGATNIESVLPYLMLQPITKFKHTQR